MPATWRRWNGAEFVTGGTWRRWDGTGWTPPLAGALDPDAEAFLTAAGITDPTSSAAVGTLVADLKAAGLWAKMHALWPIVGGSEYAHKLNLLDPRDLDAAYRMTFNGMWIHDAGGALPSSAWADTHLSPRLVLTADSGSAGIYVTTDAVGGYDFACDDGDVNPVCVIARYSTSNYYLAYGDTTGTFGPSASTADARGMWATNRLSVTTTQAVKNGAVVGTLGNTVTLPNVARTLFLGANNKAGTAVYYSAKQYALAYVSDGLSIPELADLYTAVQTFQTALGREV